MPIQVPSYIKTTSIDSEKCRKTKERFVKCWGTPESGTSITTELRLDWIRKEGSTKINRPGKVAPEFENIIEKDSHWFLLWDLQPAASLSDVC